MRQPVTITLRQADIKKTGGEVVSNRAEISLSGIKIPAIREVFYQKEDTLGV